MYIFILKFCIYFHVEEKLKFSNLSQEHKSELIKHENTLRISQPVFLAQIISSPF